MRPAPSGSIMVLPFLLLIPTVNAYLSVEHFSYSFFLNHTQPAPCGINIGSDALNIDPTSAIHGTGSIPISPSFYFYDGKRCRSSSSDHAPYFVIAPGFQYGALSSSSSLVRIAERMEQEAGGENVVTFAGAHLREVMGRMWQETIVPTKGGGRIERVSGDLVPGAVRCGQHNVLGALFVRVDRKTEVEDDGGKVFKMLPGKMYAVVGTEEETCLYSGFTRAPEGPLNDEGMISDEGVSEPEGEGNSGGKGNSVLGAVIGGSLALLVVIVLVVLFTLWFFKRRNNRSEATEVQEGNR